MKYLGHLCKKDPLYNYLTFNILPLTGEKIEKAEFRVHQLNASNHVYLYTEIHSQKRLIGKFFFGVEGRTQETAQKYMHREYNHLMWLRSLGFSSYPHAVAQPYGVNEQLNCVLVEEYSEAIPFTSFLADGAKGKKTRLLYQKLTALAYFLAQLHNNTACNEKVYFEQEANYFIRLIKKLSLSHYLEEEEASYFKNLLNEWKCKHFMHQDVQVIVHGDPTPANILFGNGLSVVAIDLERMKRRDRVFDVGRVVGEIKHFFMREGHGELAEPLIGHFLWEYCCHFPDREEAFRSITKRVPFYLGMTLLRIARNGWVSPSYRKDLLREAASNLM